ncbi:MAG: RagB/SusD family nutrient uptake outer membrane protein [Prevotellaceae bacterium]|nr:RagB/SusD family nutrient uptake outer membrane protein [Prevotellaceae bacterium]
MKRIALYSLFLGGIALTGVSCNEEFLTIYPTSQVAAGAPATQDVIDQQLVSAYQTLLLDSYADGQLVSIATFGDVRSDDLYCGGADMNDQANVYRHSQYTVTEVNQLDGYWGIYYTGLQRCNAVLQSCSNAVDVAPSILNRLRAEALTLRAYYVHQLWKGFGNIVYYEETPGPPYFVAPQYTADQIYAEIIEDLNAAIATEDFPLSTTGADAGRVNKAAAMMTKARVVMYQNDQARYAEVLADMKTIIEDGAYDLIRTSPDAKLTANPITWMFLREGEFCKESIFEANHLPEGKSWGNSWSGYGNYLPKCGAPRDLNDPTGTFDAGWGLFPVQRGTFERIFNEDGDCRKEASAIEWPSSAYNGGFQATGLFMGKYAARTGYNDNTTGDAALNYENNMRIYRLAETYLNAAELSFYNGGAGAAQPYLDAIRARAFGDNDHSIEATLANIKLERHRELFGEGQRFWDLVRWGSDETGKTTAQVLTVNDSEFFMSRTWEDYKKYLPLPKAELDKTKGTEYELKPNPGWPQ